MRHTLKKLNIRLMALVMAAVLFLCAVPVVSAAEDSGSCGSGLTWTFSGDTLTITGSGAMEDYPEDNLAPWYEYRHQITTVLLPEGLTRVGDLAFYGCEQIRSIRLPDSVTEVGWHAFHDCVRLTILDLGSGLRVIEDGAFRGCVSLPTLRLPDTLTTIGEQAFWRCESLANVTVPASVKELGSTTFAFCYSLIRADIQAEITVLPDWTFYDCSRLATVMLPDTLTGADEMAFYGCVSLSDVVYNGSKSGRTQIEADICRDLNKTPDSSFITEEAPETSFSDFATEDSEKTVISTDTVTETENATVNTKVSVIIPSGENGQLSQETEVTITLETAKGWNEVSETVSQTVEKTEKTEVTIYIKDGSSLSSDTLAALAGKNVIVTVHTAGGSVWKIDCSNLNVGGGTDLSYERLDATEEQIALMLAESGYQIHFLADAEVNAEVMIRLPIENARKTATLFVESDGIDAVQSVVVDDQGYAHFYLATVKADAVYLVGLNVRSVSTDNPIIPDTLHSQYGIKDPVSNVEYVVTGRTSSWGMDIKQVTMFLVFGMAALVITVAVVMFLLNKRKLKRGYVPDIDEEDYNT